MDDERDLRPATEGDLQRSEDGMVQLVAQMHEGIILTILSICETLIAKGAVKREDFIVALRGTSEGLLKEQQPALMHQPADKLLKYLEQLRDGDAPRPPRN